MFHTHIVRCVNYTRPLTFIEICPGRKSYFCFLDATMYTTSLLLSIFQEHYINHTCFFEICIQPKHPDPGTHIREPKPSHPKMAGSRSGQNGVQMMPGGSTSAIVLGGCIWARDGLIQMLDMQNLTFTSRGLVGSARDSASGAGS